MSIVYDRKAAETPIIHFGQNGYWNQKKLFLSAETDTETENHTIG